MSDDFFPEIPDSGSRYMKLEKGSNKFRMLSKPIDGFQYWVDVEESRKPIRTPRTAKILDASKFGEPKYFLAMVVWNYSANQIQILELTQKTIMRVMRSYSTNPKYGNPTKYDFLIERDGDGKDTEYTVTADPPEEISDEVKSAFKATPVNLSALYSSKEAKFGGDPFAVEEEIDSEEVDEFSVNDDE